MDLYIGNLHNTVKVHELEELFEPYGRIVDVKLNLGKKAKSKGYGFLTLENEQAAQRAIEELNGRMTRGMALIVKMNRPKK